MFESHADAKSVISVIDTNNNYKTRCENVVMQSLNYCGQLLSNIAASHANTPQDLSVRPTARDVLCDPDQSEDQCYPLHDHLVVLTSEYLDM